MENSSEDPIIMCANESCSKFFWEGNMPFKHVDCTNECVYCWDCTKERFDSKTGSIHCDKCDEDRPAQTDKLINPEYLLAAMRQYSLQSMKQQICQIHQDSLENRKCLYCKPCQQFICLKCEHTDHKNHINQIVLLEERKSEIQDELQERIRTLREIRNQKAKSIENISNLLSQATSDKEEIKGLISTNLSEIKTKLEDCIKDYNSQNQDFFREKNGIYNKEAKDYEAKKKLYQDFSAIFKEYIDKLENSDDYVKYMQNLPLVIEHLNKRIQDLSDLPKYLALTDEFAHGNIVHHVNTDELREENIEELLILDNSHKEITIPFE